MSDGPLDRSVCCPLVLGVMNLWSDPSNLNSTGCGENPGILSLPMMLKCLWMMSPNPDNITHLVRVGSQIRVSWLGLSHSFLDMLKNLLQGLKRLVRNFS